MSLKNPLPKQSMSVAETFCTWRMKKTKRKKMETGQVWEDLISDYPNILKLHKIQKYDTILGRNGETPGRTEVKVSFH